MNNRNKRYTREFKEEAVRQLLTGTKSAWVADITYVWTLAGSAKTAHFFAQW